MPSALKVALTFQSAHERVQRAGAYSVAVPPEFLDHTESEDWLFDGMVKNMQADQAGIEVAIIGQVLLWQSLYCTHRTAESSQLVFPSALSASRFVCRPVLLGEARRTWHRAACRRYADLAGPRRSNTGRAILGSPLLASDSLRFEMYQKSFRRSMREITSGSRSLRDGSSSATLKARHGFPERNGEGAGASTVGFGISGPIALCGPVMKDTVQDSSFQS
jgi:hypothetical protein